MTVQDPTIIVNIDEELVVLIGTPEDFTIQSHNPEFVKAAKANMERIKQVPLIPGQPRKTFPTGKSTYLELAASIIAINPGQAIIETAPAEVLDALEAAHGENKPGAIY